MRDGPRIPPMLNTPEATDIAGLNAKLDKMVGALNDRYRHIDLLIPTKTDYGSLIVDNHINRFTKYPPTTYAGYCLWEMDRSLLYISRQMPGAYPGLNWWSYVAGRMSAPLANRPVDMAANDAGALFFASDTLANYHWTGSAWVNDNSGPLTIVGDAKNWANIAATMMSITDTEAAAAGANGGRLLRAWNRYNSAYISQNLSTPDGSTWNLDQTGSPGILVTINNGSFSIAFATAGTNPRTLTTVLASSAATPLAVNGVAGYSGTFGYAKPGSGSGNITVSSGIITSVT